MEHVSKELDKQYPGIGDPRPEVVCLCGSTRYKTLFDKENRRLTLEGKIVLGPGVYVHCDPVKVSDEDKQRLDDLHRWKIDWADSVHVINPSGYIGDSTREEISYAKVAGRPITYLEEPDES